MKTSKLNVVGLRHFLMIAALAPSLVITECGAAQLAVANQSFEDPVLADGAVVFSVPGWTGQGTVAVQNPDTSFFFNAGDGSPNSTLHGQNAGSVNTGGKLSHQTTHTVLPDVIYSVNFLAGRRLGANPFGTSSLSLWAGNILLAERFPVPVEGFFSAFSLSYTSPPSGAVLGLPLRIELKAVGANAQPWFDNIRLFADPFVCTPHKAAATAQLVNGIFVGATITDQGCGYTNPPSIVIQGGGGSNALATAIMTDGRVTGIQVISGGCCYTNVPTMVFSSPPFIPTVGIRVNTVIVSQRVEIGHKYVLESSFDLANWMATGPSFTAATELVEGVFDVSATGRYFRLREVP
jgi:hypothetical protein